MDENALCCLVDRDNEHYHLDLVKLDEIPQKPEINLEKEVWKSEPYSWRKIGHDSGGSDQIRFIFDRTNFEHLRRALEIAQDFQR